MRCLLACSLKYTPLSLDSVQHTSASLVLNENADPDVRADLERWCNLSVPEGPSAPWQHTDEGHDDMPAHVKAAVFGSSLTLPITDGRLALVRRNDRTLIAGATI